MLLRGPSCKRQESRAVDQACGSELRLEGECAGPQVGVHTVEWEVGQSQLLDRPGQRARKSGTTGDPAEPSEGLLCGKPMGHPGPDRLERQRGGRNALLLQEELLRELCREAEQR